jgi:hypothetical protein
VQITAARHAIKTDCGVGVAAASNTCCDIVLGVLVLQATMVVLCPEECRCDLGRYNVDCSGLSLNNIPLIFPTNVSSLMLYDNNITSLQKDSFVSRGLTELEHFTVSSCELERIELGAFNGLTKLTYLSMSFNELSEIIPRTFEKLSSLVILHLNYNRLEHLEFDVFLGLSKVEHLSLKGNELQCLHPDLFVGLPNLEHLVFAFNRYLQLPTDRHFINSNSLSYLDISLCCISSVSVETFANFSALEWLDLSENRLSSVDINILKVLPKLSTLYLDGNPLQCDCQLQEVWRWYQDHSILTASGNRAPRCDTPSEVQGIWWGVLEKGQWLQGNIYYYGYYESTSYRYNPAEDTDTDMETVKDWGFKINRLNFIKYVQALVCAVLFIFGTTGKAILLNIIICNKDMQTVTNMYILNLAISDMIFLMAYFAESCTNIISDTWLYGDSTYAFLQFCSSMSDGLSAYNLAVLSIQRYLCSEYYILHCETYGKIVAVFQLLVSCVLPLCVIAFSYNMMARHLVKSAQPISEETQNHQLNTRKNTAKIVLGLTVVFLISYVPYHVWCTYVIFNMFSLSDEQLVDKLQYTYFVSTSLLLLNSCLNPVALFCTSLAFRRQFKRYLNCCSKANPTASNIELTRRN